MFLSLSSWITVVFLCSLIMMFLCYYLRDINRMVQTGIKSIFIFIGIMAFRLAFPVEFTFSSSYASKRIMPPISNFFHTTIFRISNCSFTILHLLMAIWLVGILINTVITIKTRVYFGRLINHLPVVGDVEIQEMIHEITRTYGKPVAFQVISSDLIATPMLYGIRRPKIIVPKIDLTHGEWYFILKHEIAHYYHRDLLIKMLMQLLRILYWWNPFVYLLNEEIDKLLEIRTDLQATKDLNDYEKIQYLDCLLKVAKTLHTEKQHFYSVAFDSGSNAVLAQRFHLILGDGKASRRPPAGTMLRAVPLVVLLAFSFIAVFEPYAIDPMDESYTVEITAINAYLVERQGGSYDLYYHDEYFGTVSSREAFFDLPIYKSIEEVKQNEILKF